MMVMTSTAVGSVGERHATAVLVARGFACNTDTRQPGATDIEAVHRSGHPGLLVQVKTAVAPNLPSGLSAQEERSIKARASRLAREAWLAQVQIDAHGDLVGLVSWTKLN